MDSIAIRPARRSTASTKPPTKDISPIDYAANFSAFLAEHPEGKPFCFWYGGHEPHRPYELGSGLRSGKKLSDVTLPPYYPDSDVIRSDMLDYAFEIEWFDRHLGLMLKKLEEIGELDNTLVVVTSDNGMPFPRDKGHMFEDACHMPLAIRWKGVVTRGRTADDFISFTDFAPTFLEATGLKPHEQMSGHKFMNVLKAETSGQVDPSRDHVILGGQKRHRLVATQRRRLSRAMHSHAGLLVLANFKPDVAVRESGTGLSRYR